MINVPEICLPLLLEHRTHYAGDLAQGYALELEQTYNGLKSFLPAIAEPKILDIGCGMAGIDALLSAHYQHLAKFTILDKQGCSDVVNAGFHKSAETFAHYHDFKAALELLDANEVPSENVKSLDISKKKFPAAKFDLVISLLSWGFHYPIHTYEPKLEPGGVIIADIRKGTDGENQLGSFGKLTVVHDALKYRRVVVQC